MEGFTYLINESIAIINFIYLYACIYRTLPITNPKLFSLFEMVSHQRYTFCRVTFCIVYQHEMRFIIFVVKKDGLQALPQHQPIKSSDGICMTK